MVTLLRYSYPSLSLILSSSNSRPGGRSLALVLSVMFFAITAVSSPARGQSGWINEFHYDNDGADSGEFVEIVLADVDQYDIDKFSIYLVNGSDGTVYNQASGTAFSQGEREGLFTILTWEPGSLQNGADGIALAYGETLLHFVSYEGSFAGGESPVLNTVSRDVGVVETPTTAPNRSLQLYGTGGHPAGLEWSSPREASPGSINTDQILRGVPLQIVPQPTTAAPGDTVRLAFILGSSAYPAEDIMGAGFQLDVDTALFTPLELLPGPFLSRDTLSFRRVQSAAGRVAYSVTTTDSVHAQSGADTLATLYLRVEHAAVGDTTIFFRPHDLMATQISGTPLALASLPQGLTLASTPVLSVSTTVLDLGIVDLSSGATGTLTITNPGRAPLEIIDITTTRSDLTVDPSSFTLAPGDSQLVTVSVPAAGDSSISETLTISSNDPDTPSLEVTVEGTSGALVWPGDTDNNGVVDALDVLPVGQYFGLSGPPRTGRSLAWRAAPAVPWSPTAATYADAAGDGHITQNDIQPIGLNYDRERPAGKTSVPRPYRSLSIGRYSQGSDITIHMAVAGDRPIENLLGVGFGLSYPSRALEFTSIEHRLGAATQDLLTFEHVDEEAGLLEAAYTRKREAGGITAGGTLVSITFRATAPISSGLTIGLQQAATSSVGRIDRSPDVQIEASASRDRARPTAFSLRGAYPNPFNSSTTILMDLPDAAAVRVTVYDMLGRSLIRLPARDLAAGYGRRIVVDASRLTSGTYLYRVNAETSDGMSSNSGTFTLIK